MKPSVTQIPVHKISGVEISTSQDFLAVEEPLEIRLVVNGETRSLSITMRTPGADFDLARGFLLTENIILSAAQIADMQMCGQQNNVVKITLAQNTEIDFDRLQRHFYTSSSCGVCGKTSIEALQSTACPSLANNNLQISPELIHKLPAQLRAAQSVFDSTGGLHAAALFDAQGNMQILREDVGRHNAVDKLIGAQLQAEKIPLQKNILLVSGRASFELVQKALMAGIPILAAVGAPSSLAVELAKQFGMTVIGFVRDGRFNIYCGSERVSEGATVREG